MNRVPVIDSRLWISTRTTMYKVAHTMHVAMSRVGVISAATIRPHWAVQSKGSRDTRASV